MGTVLISSDVGALDEGGLKWRQSTCNCVDGIDWMSNITTFSSRHKLHNPDRRRQILD